jgi:hypothetical protein
MGMAVGCQEIAGRRGEDGAALKIGKCKLENANWGAGGSGRKNAVIIDRFERIS